MVSKLLDVWAETRQTMKAQMIAARLELNAENCRSGCGMRCVGQIRALDIHLLASAYKLL